MMSLSNHNTVRSSGNSNGTSSSYNEDLFRRQVYAALKAARTVLELERRPRGFFDEQTMHTYDDKFAIAELLANTSVAAISNVLNALGLSPDHQATVLAWRHGLSSSSSTNAEKQKQPVTLRFIAHDTCTFLKEVDVEVPSGHGDVLKVTTTTKTTEKSSTGGGVGVQLFGSSNTTTTGNNNNNNTTRTSDTTISVTRKIKEYHWKVGIEHQLLVFPANSYQGSGEECLILQSRKTETVLITQQQNTAPLPESTLHGAVDVSLDWFFDQIDPTDQSCQFAIHRGHDHPDDKTTTTTTTKKKTSTAALTPRRNAEVEAAIMAHQELKEWSRLTQGFFLQRVEREMLGQDHPVVPRATTMAAANKAAAATTHHRIMEPGRTGVIYGLSKEPTFNGQRVRIISYDTIAGRYKAEPLDMQSSGLPPTLSIKPDNIQPDNDDTTSMVVVVNAGPPLSTITDEGILLPILPLVDRDTGNVVTDVNEFLQEQARTIDEALDGLSRVYPSRQLVKLVSVAEASIVLLCKHLERLCRMLQDGLDHVEHMLQKQLMTAIGQSGGITSADFGNFMAYHYPQLLGHMYAPTPFCRAIRQPGHFPDGMIAIEKNVDSNNNNNGPGQPILTWMRTVPGGADSAAPPMRLPIHAAASVAITGDRFLHGWMVHQFASEPLPPPRLACRARQFSSFLIVLGHVAGPDSFEPQQAIILQNKDEVLIPLLLTPLPSAKAFRDAIHSLSPDQQEFAKAYRSMQLSSSVFGVCVIQIKPQLEKLLELPVGSLTKEIKLTQDLMSLFVDYQIPSDMLTYDGAVDADAADKLAAVKGHVHSVMDVIDESKRRQLKEEEMKADMRTEVGHKKNINFLGTMETADVAAEENMLFSMAAPAPRTMRMGSRSLAAATPGFARSDMMMKRAKLSIQSEAPQFKQQQERRVENAPMGSAEKTPVAPAPTVQQPKPAGIGQQNAPTSGDEDSSTRTTTTTGVDFTLIPKILDAKLEALDSDGALRSTTIKASDQWTRRRQENLLLSATTTVLTTDDISHETKRAFDLLDCLSRSGTLPIDCAELHVFVAVSHHFEKECVQTIVQDNVNPIAKMERSALILASTTFGVRPDHLLRHQHDAGRLQAAFPHLFLALEDSGGTASATATTTTTPSS